MVVKLRYLPAYILVKLSRTKGSKLSALGDCVIPMEPSSTTYRTTMTTKGGKKGPRTVQRCQFPITAAYAFTDYHSQGQTISYGLVDVVPPPRGTLSLFNLYVALSIKKFQKGYNSPAVILTMTCSGNLMVQHCCKKLSDWRRWIRK